MFSVTYEILSPNAVEHGETDDSGFLSQGLSLRDVVEELFETRTSKVSGVVTIEPNCETSPRWVSVFNGMEYETGANEVRSIHFPDTLTPSRRRHITNLLCNRSF